MRGRDCLLDRDWLANPAPFSVKIKNFPEYSGVIRSEEEFFEVVQNILDLYQIDDIRVALRRIGKGICPKSFPLSRESLYFLDIYSRTHGGETGTQLVHLPVSGAVLDQPNLFYVIADVISRVKAKHLRAKYASEDNVSRGTGTPSRDKGKAYAGKDSPKAS